MQLRTDRVSLLLDQFDASIQISRARMDGLTDAEYLWEPVPGAWSIRRRGETSTSGAYGKGRWRLDFERDEPQPPPVTTIAWRIGHLYSGFLLRWEWTFGGKRRLWGSVELAPHADEAQAQLWSMLARWREDVGNLTEVQLDTVGLSQFPHGLDPNLPFIGIIWWTNRELIHHTGEIGVLRDLWAARPWSRKERLDVGSDP
jgi:hypothetical protein